MNVTLRRRQATIYTVQEELCLTIDSELGEWSATNLLALYEAETERSPKTEATGAPYLYLKTLKIHF
jgi:hypothetical protein